MNRICCLICTIAILSLSCSKLPADETRVTVGGFEVIMNDKPELEFWLEGSPQPSKMKEKNTIQYKGLRECRGATDECVDIHFDAYAWQRSSDTETPDQAHITYAVEGSVAVDGFSELLIETGLSFTDFFSGGGDEIVVNAAFVLNGHIPVFPGESQYSLTFKQAKNPEVVYTTSQQTLVLLDADFLVPDADDPGCLGWTFGDPVPNDGLGRWLGGDPANGLAPDWPSIACDETTLTLIIPNAGDPGCLGWQSTDPVPNGGEGPFIDGNSNNGIAPDWPSIACSGISLPALIPDAQDPACGGWTLFDPIPNQGMGKWFGGSPDACLAPDWPAAECGEAEILVPNHEDPGCLGWTLNVDPIPNNGDGPLLDGELAPDWPSIACSAVTILVPDSDDAACGGWELDDPVPNDGLGAWIDGTPENCLAVDWPSLACGEATLTPVLPDPDDPDCLGWQFGDPIPNGALGKWFGGDEANGLAPDWPDPACNEFHPAGAEAVIEIESELQGKNLRVLFSSPFTENQAVEIPADATFEERMVVPSE